MSREVTWRLYLDEIVRCKPSAEKKRLYDAVQVTRTAFQRWRNGENTPDAAHIALLLKALPNEERERLQALMSEDAKVQTLLPREAILLGRQAPDRIPQEVYEEALRIGRETPDRFWLLCSTLLFHALSQIETYPKQAGVEVSVARCMPARSDGKVRSLREYAGRGTPPLARGFAYQGLISRSRITGRACSHAASWHHGSRPKQPQECCTRSSDAA